MDMESEIIDYIKKYNKEEYPKIIEKDDRLEVILSLSDIRENIISWYPFKENSNILEIGADFGQITGALCQKANKVVAQEALSEKCEAILKRHNDMKNLTVIKDLEELKEQFGYIVIVRN